MVALPFSEKDIRRLRTPHTALPSISAFYQVLNVLGCFLSVVAYAAIFRYSHVPLTLDILFTIFLAETNRLNIEKRRQQLRTSLTKSLSYKPELSASKIFPIDKDISDPGCVAAVVGYREDPQLFERALQSYIGARGCKFMLVGIDGDEAEDQEMINVFKQVYPTNSALLHLDKPLAELAIQFDKNVVNPAFGSLYDHSFDRDSAAMSFCCQTVRDLLEAKNIKFSGPNAVSKLCISQSHMHKKGIMFTSFIFSIVISEMLGIEYLWSSDSDSIIFEDTIARTMSTMAGDPTVGGASAALQIHNSEENLITKLGNAVYLSELYLARSFPSAVGANDCQSGPAAAFRVSALRDMMLPWYKQHVFGSWMIVNEDRHLTTNLLLRGWRVVFAADASTATDTPATLRRWILQQVRWARAVHIESFCKPRIYLLQSPVLFFAAFRREVGSLVVWFGILFYMLTGKLIWVLSWSDLISRTIWTIAYIALRNPYRPNWSTWLWLMPGQVFYNFPLPAIQIWSLVTILDGSWGTTMRNSFEITRQARLKTKVYELGFFVLWSGVASGAITRLLGTALNLEIIYLSMLILGAVFSSWVGFGWWMVVTK
ncbi:glycosyltransferase family 2 protein [Glonium stellatum]|uniref:Glycosyltransferase family 2 protein n=1 Tax=Glonium stellatum TaxID=574774 RepID=A0A8E2FAK6_9PEZI|nr:glycosyltransferase family 2 protein [Glonium stellatum]